jgi:hypothetical protein
MAYDEFLAERINTVLAKKGISFEAKKMMGGLCYMVDDKMCVGVVKDKLMARIGPEKYEMALARKGCHEMDFTRKTMKGFVYVEPEGIDMESELEYWIDMALEFNPLAFSSKRKKK